jgi:germination protein M
MKSFKIIVFALAALLLLATAGCAPGGQPAAGSGSDASSSQTNTTPKTGDKKNDPAVAQNLQVKLYYPNDDATKLVAVMQQVPAHDKYQASVKALMAGTKQAGLIGIFPKEAKLRSVTVKDGLATVDFSRELTRRFVGGSTGELMLVGSLVDTLTEFPEIKKVQIKIEGQIVETIAGHMDTSAPFVRMEKLIQ